MRFVGLKCQSCGMIYTLGVDSKVFTDLPTPTGPKDKFMNRDFLQLHAAGSNKNDPDSIWFLPDPQFQEYGQDKPYRPDDLWGSPWSQMASKMREEAELELARLVFLLSTGYPRHWKCPKCDTVQFYPPPTSFMAK